MKPLLVFLALPLLLTLGACGGGEIAASQDSAGTAATQPQASSELKPASDTIAVGSPAPSFSLPGSDGQTHQLRDYAGQYVILAFFPKAFTGG